MDRTEDVTKVTVYSNLPSVELFANGVSLGVKEATDHFFYFDVPNVGETKLVAVADACRDKSVIRKVSQPNPAYRLVEKGAILNWWDITEVPGHASLNTKVDKIIASIGVDALTEMLKPIVQMSAVPSVIALLSTMTVIRQINLLTGATNTPVTKEQLLNLNAQLNQIAI